MSVTSTLNVAPRPELGVGGRRAGRLHKGPGKSPWSSRSTEESVLSGSDHRNHFSKQVVCQQWVHNVHVCGVDVLLQHSSFVVTKRKILSFSTVHFLAFEHLYDFI